MGILLSPELETRGEDRESKLKLFFMKIVTDEEEEEEEGEGEEVEDKSS